MNKMTIEIQEAIAQNLPAQVGNALQQRLVQADKDAAEVARLKEELASAQASTAEYRDIGLAHERTIETLTAKLAAFEKREQEIEKAERRILVAEMRMESAERVTAAVKDVIAVVFRNNELKRSVLTSTSVPVAITPYQGANQEVRHYNGSDSMTETVEG